MVASIWARRRLGSLPNSLKLGSIGLLYNKTAPVRLRSTRCPAEAGTRSTAPLSRPGAPRAPMPPSTLTRPPFHTSSSTVPSGSAPGSGRSKRRGWCPACKQDDQLLVAQRAAEGVEGRVAAQRAGSRPGAGPGALCAGRWPAGHRRADLVFQALRPRACRGGSRGRWPLSHGWGRPGAPMPISSP